MKVCMKPRSINWLHPHSQLVLLNAKFSKIKCEVLYLGWKNPTEGVEMWDQAERKQLQKKPECAGGQLEPEPAVCPWNRKWPSASWEELAGMQPAAREKCSFSSIQHLWGHTPRAVSHLVSLGTSWVHWSEILQRAGRVDGAQELRRG